MKSSHNPLEENKIKTKDNINKTKQWNYMPNNSIKELYKQTIATNNESRQILILRSFACVEIQHMHTWEGVDI